MTTDPVCHILGIDLGQTQDPSALVIVERRPLPGGVYEYACRKLRRWPLGTTYPKIADDVVAASADPRLTDPVLAVDQTGVGRPVVDLIRLKATCAFRPVTITAGHRWSLQPDGSYNVPKKDLVGCLQSLMGHRRLQVSGREPEADTLVKELQNFRVKITLDANETFAAWREGRHDDLVLSLAIACWIGEHAYSGPMLPQDSRSRSEVDRSPAGVFLETESDEW